MGKPKTSTFTVYTPDGVASLKDLIRSPGAYSHSERFVCPRSWRCEQFGGRHPKCPRAKKCKRYDITIVEVQGDE